MTQIYGVEPGQQCANPSTKTCNTKSKTFQQRMLDYLLILLKMLHWHSYSIQQHSYKKHMIDNIMDSRYNLKCNINCNIQINASLQQANNVYCIIIPTDSNAAQQIKKSGKYNQCNTSTIIITICQQYKLQFKNIYDTNKWRGAWSITYELMNQTFAT